MFMTDMMMQRRIQDYTAPEDFCFIFQRDMQQLYALALVLTADHESAEKCFTGALERCRAATGVFKAWAERWSRIAIIESAIHLARPAVRNTPSAAPDGMHPEVVPVLRLDSFHRFVFVLSVLERFSSSDCAVLLKCSLKDVEKAKLRAFDLISGITSGDTAPLWLNSAASAVA